jgi:NAD dependent epimerase/dehydratase
LNRNVAAPVLSPVTMSLARTNHALVTGAGGFIGSHLVEAAVQEGYRVRAFVHYNSRGNWGWLEESSVRSEVEIVSGDIRDFDSVRAAVQGCDTVFHLAALIGIPYSYTSPLAYVKTNIEGTYNILEASRHSEVENVLITSTSETYGSAQYVPIDEAHPAVGQSPYAATKIGADQLALSYWRSFGTPVKIVRPFNTYGPRQSARAIIPTIVTQIATGAEQLRLGNLTPTRDFSFVRDTAAAFLAVARCKECQGLAVNAGANQELSILDLAKKIASLLTAEVTITEDSDRLRPQASEVDRLRCDNTLIRTLTGWQPQWTLDRGLADTIGWLAAHHAMYKPNVYST